MRVGCEPRDTPTTSFGQARVQSKKVNFTDLVRVNNASRLANPGIHIQHLSGRTECNLKKRNKKCCFG
jgi:hypothetical protein